MSSALFFGRKSGFTLTEILIVVIIIGVLATLSLPMLVKTIEKAKVGEAISNLNLIRTGQKIYFLEYGEFTSNISDLNIEDPTETASNYFSYEMDNVEASDFTVKAIRKSNAPGDYAGLEYYIEKNGILTSNGPFFPDPE